MRRGMKPLAEMLPLPRMCSGTIFESVNQVAVIRNVEQPVIAPESKTLR
jgi:hypothetical protein